MEFDLISDCGSRRLTGDGPAGVVARFPMECDLISDCGSVRLDWKLELGYCMEVNGCGPSKHRRKAGRNAGSSSPKKTESIFF